MVADGYKDTEIGVIPVGWEVEKIDNLLEKFQNGYAFSSKGYKENGTPIVSMASISLDGKFQFNYKKAKYWDSEKLDDLEAFTLNKNDLIIAMTDVTPDKKLIGRMAIVDIDDTFLLNQRVGLLKLKDNINNIFLSNYSNHTKWRSYSKNISALGAQANLSTKDIKEAKIPLPPLKEQEKIADILSTADEKIDAIEEQIQRAETLKKGLLQKLLSEGINHCEFKDSELGKIPESWEVVKLSQVVSINPNSLTNSTNPDFEIEYIDIASIVETGTISETNLYKFSDAPSRARRIVNKNDILLSTVRPYLKSFSIVKENKDNLICSTGYAVLRAKEQTYYEYIYQFVLADVFMGQVDTMLVGSNYPAINSNDVKNIKLPLPPLKEQKQIADILSTADEKLEVLRAKKEKYETLKKGLLQKLLSGEIRV